MNSRKHPRTMQEAFGPYTSHEIHDPDRRKGGWGAYAVVVVLLILTLIIVK